MTFDTISLWIQQHYCFIHVNMSNVFLFLHEHHIHYNYWTNNCVKSSRNYKNFKQHQHSGTLDENLPLIIFFSLVFSSLHSPLWLFSRSPSMFFLFMQHKLIFYCLLQKKLIITQWKRKPTKFAMIAGQNLSRKLKQTRPISARVRCKLSSRVWNEEENAIEASRRWSRDFWTWNKSTAWDERIFVFKLHSTHV